MKNPSKWYSRKHTGSLGAALIIIGTWTAIVFLPTIFISLLLFALIGGSGAIICHKLRSDLFWLSVVLGITACGYALISVAVLFETIDLALLFDSLKIIVPVMILGTLAFAWLGRNKLRRPEWFYSTESSVVTAFKKLAPFTLLIVTPLIIGGLHDYNVRADISPPQVITVKVVDKWIDSDDWEWITVETLDGSLRYSFHPTRTWYDDLDVGSIYETEIRKGALGYPWIPHKHAFEFWRE